jgi:hypothetical protein
VRHIQTSQGYAWSGDENYWHTFHWDKQPRRYNQSEFDAIRLVRERDYRLMLAVVRAAEKYVSTIPQKTAVMRGSLVDTVRRFNAKPSKSKVGRKS